MPRLTLSSSTQDLADASIWEHCCELLRNLWGYGMRMLMYETLINLTALLVILVCVLTMPISLPLIAYLRRRHARREIQAWHDRHKETL